jgi:hypothetical protein
MLSKLLKTTQIKAGVLSLLNAKLDAKAQTKHFTKPTKNNTSRRVSAFKNNRIRTFLQTA